MPEPTALELMLATIVQLFTDLGLLVYVGIGVVLGAVGYLFGRVAKAGR